jgi:hypothetical protein
VTEAERKAHFYMAKKTRDALDVVATDPTEIAYLTDDVRLAVIKLTKQHFSLAGWDEDAIRGEITRSRMKIVEDEG